MSNQISLTIPNDDPIALRAFGNALEEMAVAHGAVVRKSVAEMTVKIDGTEAAQAVRDALEEFTDDDTQLATDDTLDADGLPWDARIHSGNRERNADNTWRARRKPKDMTPEQWEEQVAQVRDELFALMAIPVADPVVVADECPGDSTCTDQGCPHHYADEPESAATVFGASDPVEVPPAPEPLPVVTVADPVPPAPEPVADPVPPAPAPLPPVTAQATDAIPTTLAEFMTSLTKYGPKDPSNKDECAAHVARVNEIVARHGLVSVGQLAKRLDLIPQVYADLVKELGV